MDPNEKSFNDVLFRKEYKSKDCIKAVLTTYIFTSQTCNIMPCETNLPLVQIAIDVSQYPIEGHRPQISRNKWCKPNRRHNCVGDNWSCASFLRMEFMLHVISRAQARGENANTHSGGYPNCQGFANNRTLKFSILLPQLRSCLATFRNVVFNGFVL